MTNFFYNNIFYEDIPAFMEDLEIDEETIDQCRDSYSIKLGELQPIIKLDTEWILDRIDEERFTENGDEVEKLEDILKKYIDFDKVNSMIPKLWYETYKKVEITKADLYSYL
jgi:hypothetical protein